MTQLNLLDSFTEKAISAHNWTSHFPEKIGEQLIKDYNGQLEEDIEELTAAGISKEIIQEYRNRYTSLFSSWLGAKSNCASSFITGGSGFNVRRAEKANRSESRHYEIWQEWRLRAKKAIVRKAQPAKTYLSEIDRYKSELECMRKNQTIMKNCNVIIRKSKGKDCKEALMLAGLSEKNAIEIQKPDFAGRIGFAQFSLTNNNANMKRVEQRIKELSEKEQARQEPEKSYKFEGGEVIMNYEADRVQILFDAKPDEEKRKMLKSSGFKWSPTYGAWQRQLTANGIWTTKRIFNQL